MTENSTAMEKVIDAQKKDQKATVEVTAGLKSKRAWLFTYYVNSLRSLTFRRV